MQCLQAADENFSRPSVKVTYLDRQKRKRNTKETTDDHSDSSSATQSKQALKRSGRSSSVTSWVALEGHAHASSAMPRSRPASASRDLVQVETDPLSSPAPNRARGDSDVSTRSAASVSKKASHRLSVTLKAATQAAASSSTPKKKPSSAASVGSMKPPSRKRAATPDSDMDDAASIAESTFSVKTKRRSEPERIQYFKNQPYCGKLEPHDAECTRCGKMVKLGRGQTYRVRNWDLHRRRCDHIFGMSPSAVAAGYADTEDEDQGTGTSRKKIRLSLEERKALLASDPYVLNFKNDEVTCRNCNQTVRLAAGGDYRLQKWQDHRASCGDEMPSIRVEIAARKLKIVNDVQVESFGARHIVCNICKATVVLSGDEDYMLGSWEEHKSDCSKMETTTEPSEETNVATSTISTVPFPLRSPPSVASTTTEHTLIAADPRQGSLGSPSETHGLKRMREGSLVDASGNDPDARPSNRLRTEEHDGTASDGTTAMDWMMLPIRAFVRGFRESLKRA